MRILIVDDNESNRILAHSILEKEHIVVTADNGAKALNECLGVKFDLILLDTLMPGMNGVATLKKIRQAEGRNAQTPIFALTAYSSNSDYDQYKRAGFDFILSKPLRQSDFERAWNAYHNKDTAGIPAPKISKMLEHSLIDHRHWTEIQAQTTPHDLMAKSLRFWQKAEGYLAAINEHKEQASRDDVDSLRSLRKAAHNLKGAAATIALGKLEAISGELQNAPPENILNLANHISTCAQDSQRAQITILKALVSRHGSSVSHFDDANELKG